MRREEQIFQVVYLTDKMLHTCFLGPYYKTINVVGFPEESRISLVRTQRSRFFPPRA